MCSMAICSVALANGSHLLNRDLANPPSLSAMVTSRAGISIPSLYITNISQDNITYICEKYALYFKSNYLFAIFNAFGISFCDASYKLKMGSKISETNIGFKLLLASPPCRNFTTLFLYFDTFFRCQTKEKKRNLQKYIYLFKHI